MVEKLLKITGSIPITLMTIQLTGLISCLFYTCLKLKLNQFLKIILVVMFIVNSVCLIVFILSSFLEKSIQCYATAFSCALLVSGSLTMTNLISILRFYMAILAAKAKFAKEKFIIPFIIFASLICYGFASLILYLQNIFGYRNAISKCLNQGENIDSWILVGILVSFWIGMNLIGLICDILLYKFVKKQDANQNVSGSTLVPWKSTNSNLTEDLQIPIRATGISTLLIFLSMTLVILFPVFLNLESIAAKDFIGYAITFVVLFSANSPFFIVIFTIKRHKKVGQLGTFQQPPKQLQFHMDENLELESIT